MITGINHINLSASDLDASFKFYCDVMEFRPLAKWAQGAYFLAGDLWFCINYDKNARNEPLAEYTHIAFNVRPENFKQVSQRIQNAGVKIWKKNISEGESLYFLDPTGHKLEIHCTDWRARIATAKLDPEWGEIQYFDDRSITALGN